MLKEHLELLSNNLLEKADDKNKQTIHNCLIKLHIYFINPGQYVQQAKDQPISYYWNTLIKNCESILTEDSTAFDMCSKLRSNINDKLDMISEYVVGIYLGNNIVAQDDTFYKEKGIKGILNCSTEVPFYKYDIKQMRIPLNNLVENDKFYDSLETAIDFLHNNKPVLIHSYEGTNRSASIYAAYLIKYFNMTPDEAINYILKHRPYAFSWGEDTVYKPSLNKYYNSLHKKTVVKTI